MALGANKVNRLFLAILILLTVSCSKSYNPPIKTFDVPYGELRLSEKLDGDWERVCLIKPYSTNELAEQIIGFQFDVESKSGISVLDGITLVLVISNESVIEYFETPRNNVDFSSLKQNCFYRADANFQVKRGSDGWPYLQGT